MAPAFNIFARYSLDILSIVSRTHAFSILFSRYSLDILAIVSRTYAFSRIFSRYSFDMFSCVSRTYALSIIFSTASRTHEFFPPTSHIQKDRLTANAGVVVGDLG